jgi:succinyl-CoA synthetase beta subunit
VILMNPRVRGVLINVFGGITRGDEVAKGIIEASKQIDLKVPLVVRLDGTNSEEGLRLLAEAGIPNLTVEETMLGAAEKVVELANP